MDGNVICINCRQPGCTGNCQPDPTPPAPTAPGGGQQPDPQEEKPAA